ncbi:reverse transcriptase domain-containing protein [Tanacetum coccineum]
MGTSEEVVLSCGFFKWWALARDDVVRKSVCEEDMGIQRMMRMRERCEGAIALEIVLLLDLVQDLVHQQLIGPTQPFSYRTHVRCAKHGRAGKRNVIRKSELARKVQQEKLKEVKARLNFEEVSQHSESGTPSRRRDLTKRIESRRICGVSGSPEPRCGRSESPRKRDSERKTVFKRLEKVVFHRLGDKGKTISAYSSDSRRQSRTLEVMTKKQRSSIEDNLSQPWVCEETDPFTPRIRYFDLSKKTRMPSQVKTYDESEDPEDHLKIFQAAAKVERWVMPTWCHMFNSTLTGFASVWFDDLPPKSVDSYDDLKESFLANFRQQKKCIKDPVEIHHIKQREGESTEDFVRRFKVESKDVKGAPKIMRIS